MSNVQHPDRAASARRSLQKHDNRDSRDLEFPEDRSVRTVTTNRRDEGNTFTLYR